VGKGMTGGGDRECQHCQANCPRPAQRCAGWSSRMHGAESRRAVRRRKGEPYQAVWRFRRLEVSCREAPDPLSLSHRRIGRFFCNKNHSHVGSGHDST
jgi:hypothetical protein